MQMEGFKRRLGIAPRTEVQVSPGPLNSGWSSDRISFPNLCPKCLKPAAGKFVVTGPLAQTKRTADKNVRPDLEAIRFKIPVCKSCLQARKHAKGDFPLKTSLILLLLTFFYIWHLQAIIVEAWSEYSSLLNLLPLGFPLLVLVFWVRNKLDEDPVLISRIAVGRDNLRLLRRLINLREKKGAFLRAELDRNAKTTITFSFNNADYASSFREANASTLVP